MVLDQQELQTKPILANTITFNGEIISELVDVGGGFVAFNVLSGKNKEEMPTILVKGKFEETTKSLKKGDNIVAVGILKKMQGQFVIETVQINRIINEKDDKEEWKNS